MSKTVLITGASGGIGSEIVKKFAEHNYNIIYHYNNNFDKTLVENISKKTNILPIKANFKNNEEIVNMFNLAIKTFGKIDCLVNNAGVDRVCSIIDEECGAVADLLQINLTSTIVLTSLVAKQMCKHQSGAIVNISSLWGISGGSMESVYSASKAGIIGFTKATAKELGRNGIRVNAVAPGLIDTKMNNNLSSEDKAEFVNTLAINQIGSAIDVANAVYFLASDDAKYITGQILGVDGGF